MRYMHKMICAACAMVVAGGAVAAVAEDMPMAVDVAYTEEELKQAENLQAEQVIQTQKLLITLGYLYSDADGVLGPMTAAAIKEFQAAQGLDVTGEPDAQTLTALRELADSLGDAKDLQARLIELNYLRGSADGIFGPRSQAALKLFQAMQGLEVTGKADEPTRAALFSEAVQPLPARLAAGSKGDDVRELQQKLIQFGFMTGQPDGSYGKQTAAAVRRLQRQLIAQGTGEVLGITESGDADSATLALFYDPDYSSYVTELSAGEESDEVQRVERRLKQLGYMDMDADKAFDDYAVRSAQAFMGAAGVVEAGFGKGFIDALFAADAPLAEHYVLHDIALGDRGQAVREVEDALIRGGMVAAVSRGRYDEALQGVLEGLHEYLVGIGRDEAALFEDSAVVSVEAQQALQRGLLGYVRDVPEGADAAQIRRVQSRLYTLYYLQKDYVDGKYGENTQQALILFQKTNGLPQTGVANETTQRLLFSEDAVYNQRPYRVEVDIDAQRVYVFERQESGEYEQVQTFVCSTGLGDSTPRGIYLDGFPVNYWHHFEKFDCWAKYSFLIEGSIMFHSVLFNEKDTSTLREGSLYALGQKASHGCVRLKVSDAKWLFEHCKRGSLVIVIY